VTRVRHNIFLEREHSKSLKKLAVMTRLSKSSIVAAALAAYLAIDGGEGRGSLAKRLEKLSQQLERFERDQAILIETLALYIRHHFAITPPVPEAHQDAARAQGKLRFEQFVEQLVRHLQRGQSLVRDVSEQVFPSHETGRRTQEGPHDA
jgi:hypothetical protein